MIREFVEKIIVFKAEKVDGHRAQRIEIIYNCIGAVEPPEKQKNGIADFHDYAGFFKKNAPRGSHCSNKELCR